MRTIVTVINVLSFTPINCFSINYMNHIIIFNFFFIFVDVDLISCKIEKKKKKLKKMDVQIHHVE